MLSDRNQLRSIIGSGTSGKVKIGSCPLEDEADVKIDPDRLIMLDPNGEYSNTFQDFKPRIFKVYPQGEEKQLQTPSWF